MPISARASARVLAPWPLSPRRGRLAERSTLVGTPARSARLLTVLLDREHVGVKGLAPVVDFGLGAREVLGDPLDDLAGGRWRGPLPLDDSHYVVRPPVSRQGTEQRLCCCCRPGLARQGHLHFLAGHPEPVTRPYQAGLGHSFTRGPHDLSGQHARSRRG